MKNSETDYQLHGFLIGNEIRFDIANRRLYRFLGSSTDKNIVFGTILFNETMLHLFVYLLVHGRYRIISKDELLKEIWEAYDLSPSSQRLWKVLNNLIKKLDLIGLPDDFIMNIKGRGYRINYPEITPIYYRVSELCTHSSIKDEMRELLRE